MLSSISTESPTISFTIIYRQYLPHQKNTLMTLIQFSRSLNIRITITFLFSFIKTHHQLSSSFSTPSHPNCSLSSFSFSLVGGSSLGMNVTQAVLGQVAFKVGDGFGWDKVCWVGWRHCTTLSLSLTSSWRITSKDSPGDTSRFIWCLHFIPFDEYERLTNGKWGCRCHRQCAATALLNSPRIVPSRYAYHLQQCGRNNRLQCYDIYL